MTPVALLVLAASTGPTPSPLPDASPTVRGAVNTGTQQFGGAKSFSNRITDLTDAGAAFTSTCVPPNALGVCPKGNGLQCVLDAGWWACQSDAGWAQLGTGAGSFVDLTNDQSVAGVKTFTANPIAPRFIATDSSSGAAKDGGGNFVCLNNPGASSPCLSNPINVLELGGLHHSFPYDSSASVYIGALELRDGGYILSVLNDYGQGETEVHVFDVAYNGDAFIPGRITLGGQYETPGRIMCIYGSCYLQSQGALILWNKSTGDVADWFSGSGGSSAGGVKDDGTIFTPSTKTAGSCTLNGASPSTCTQTVSAGAVCTCSDQDTAALLKCKVASTTLTVTGPNAATDHASYICIPPS